MRQMCHKLKKYFIKTNPWSFHIEKALSTTAGVNRGLEWTRLKTGVVCSPKCRQNEAQILSTFLTIKLSLQQVMKWVGDTGKTTEEKNHKWLPQSSARESIGSWWSTRAILHRRWLSSRIRSTTASFWIVSYWTNGQTWTSMAKLIPGMNPISLGGRSVCHG